jgi:hypothetical protein
MLEESSENVWCCFPESSAVKDNSFEGELTPQLHQLEKLLQGDMEVDDLLRELELRCTDVDVRFRTGCELFLAPLIQ